jgi:hypothetical protein
VHYRVHVPAGELEKCGGRGRGCPASADQVVAVVVFSECRSLRDRSVLGLGREQEQVIDHVFDELSGLLDVLVAGDVVVPHRSSVRTADDRRTRLAGRTELAEPAQTGTGVRGCRSCRLLGALLAAVIR